MLRIKCRAYTNRGVVRIWNETWDTSAEELEKQWEDTVRPGAKGYAPKSAWLGQPFDLYVGNDVKLKNPPRRQTGTRLKPKRWAWDTAWDVCSR